MAKVTCGPMIRSCLVERFDRFLREDGTLRWWVQYAPTTKRAAARIEG